MVTFEGKYKNFYRRFFSLENLDLLINSIVLSSLIIIFDLSKTYTIIIGLILLIISIYIIINKSKSDINKITFEDNSIVLNGETFNRKWKKLLDIKKTYIEIQSIGSRRGLCGATFYLKLKNKKDTYIINSFETFSDEGIFEIFNEFKNHKGEKIIIDEKLVLSRIQEKIEKCQ